MREYGRESELKAKVNNFHSTVEQADVREVAQQCYFETCVLANIYFCKSTMDCDDEHVERISHSLLSQMEDLRLWFLESRICRLWTNITEESYAEFLAEDNR